MVQQYIGSNPIWNKPSSTIDYYLNLIHDYSPTGKFSREFLGKYSRNLLGISFVFESSREQFGNFKDIPGNFRENFPGNFMGNIPGIYWEFHLFLRVPGIFWENSKTFLGIFGKIFPGILGKIFPGFIGNFFCN